jgi:hypothetical protein
MPNNASVTDIKPVNQSVIDTKPLNSGISDITTKYMETRNILKGEWIPLVGFTYPNAFSFTAQRL